LVAELRAFDANPESGLVYSDAMRVRVDGRPIDRWSSHFPPVKGDAYQPMLRQNRVQTSTVLVRRDVLEELGGFNESLEAWEDVDLWLRIAARYPFAHVPEVLANYRLSGNGLSSNTMAMALGRLASVTRVVEISDGARLRAAIMRSTLANSFAHVGVAYYLQSDMSMARRWLFRSWQTDTGSMLRNRSVETFLKSLAGPGVIGSLRTRLRQRNRMQHHEEN
jgi:hypothetical protein